jgi:allophanate hydrolase-like protein
MFLNGTAMSGQPDHHAVAGAVFLGSRRTAPRYRFVAIRNSFPGLVPVAEGGGSIDGELYEMTEEALFGTLMPEEPAELELGTVQLEDGEIVNAMHLQPHRIVPGELVVDITALGGWRNYQAHLTHNSELVAWLPNPEGGSL